jgi:hypothetical protein
MCAFKKNTEQDDKENYIKMIRRGEIRRPIIRRILLLLKILHLMLVIICVSILFFFFGIGGFILVFDFSIFVEIFVGEEKTCHGGGISFYTREESCWWRRKGALVVWPMLIFLV